MSSKCNISSRLYLSGMDMDAHKKAKENHLGYEITAFCWVLEFSNENTVNSELSKAKEINNLIFHAPFAELSPCAIDPLVKNIAKKRFLESIALGSKMGIKRYVIHDGFIPLVYYKEWFVEKSVEFWKDFLKDQPDDIEILLENVMDTEPEILLEVIKGVDDKRLSVCLDVGHANSIASNIPVKTWVETLLPYIKHVHIHNNIGDKDLHQSLNDGTIDMEWVIDKTSTTNATFTIENMNCDDSLTWLRNKGYLD